VDVICRSIDDQRIAVHSIDDSTQIGEQIVFQILSDLRPPILGTEHEMVQQVCKRVRHGCPLDGESCTQCLSPLPGLYALLPIITHGSRRGLPSFAPTGAEDH
jgi:hypothetical protein